MTNIKNDDIDSDDLEEIVQGVRAIDSQLDELSRARVAAGLGRHLDARAVARARSGAGRGRARAGAVLAALRWTLPALGAAAAVWLVVGRAPSGNVTAPAPAAGRFDRLEVPAGTRARARLGRADLTVVGPAQLEVTRVAASDVTMRLSSGTLVGDYDGRAGGRLRIETPRLVADIVGTRFVIEATPAHARVSVAPGRVAVRDAATPEGAAQLFIGAGQSWEVGSARPSAIPEPVLPLLLANDAEGDAPAAARDDETKPRVAAPGVAVATVTPGPRVASAAPPAQAPEPRPATSAPPAVQPPSVDPPPPAAIEATPSPAELYRRAEGAMLSRDGAAARRWLEEIVTRYPRDVAAESARFELARDALATGAPARAARWLDDLIANGHDRSLVESASFLKCRIAREGGEAAEALGCLTRFRAEHPRSVRDQEALATLVRLAEERGACDEARVRRAEHRRLYPDVAPPEADRARCPR
jgi:TolA-binding protein